MKHMFEIKHRISNETNGPHQHWSVVARVRKSTRAKVALAYRASRPPPIRPAIVVTLVRIGPRTLDDDGLRASLKSVRDSVAAIFRCDDASPLIHFDYGQERGDYAVRVEVEVMRLVGNRGHE